MDSRYREGEARECMERYGARWGEDLAQRIYTARLLGADAKLVLHGGGNTSVKTAQPSVFGEPLEVLCVKGSGHDLARIGPDGLPALELEPLRRLQSLATLSDAEMVNQVRGRLLDATAPNPSIETLLHAFLPHKFVDHTHADAVLELTNQPRAQDLLNEVYGERVAVLPWIMPGFPLARAVLEAWQQQPDCEGVVLMQHGLLTFGETARESYERMVGLVDLAERFVDAAQPSAPPAATGAPPAAARARAAAVLPVVRGALAHAADGRLGTRHRRLVGVWRGAADLVEISSRSTTPERVRRGPLTPDHVIRTRPRYLYLDGDAAADPAACRAAVAGFAEDYRRYYDEHATAVGADAPMMDPEPRVVVVEGCGVLAFGEDVAAAGIAGDIAEQTLRSIERACAVGDYQPLPPAALFEIEYWGLELYKLRDRVASALSGQVALVTGAAGAIGAGIAGELLAAGAHVVISDLDGERLARVEARLAAEHANARIVAVTADQTDGAQVAAMFEAAVMAFGGVDVVVPNAGIAHVSTLGDMDRAAFERVMAVNTTGTMLVLREAARVFGAQRTGGAVVVQSSKNVFDPGAGFGAYSASKAAAHQLGKVAALELAPLGVRVNMVNADAVFGDDEVPSGLWAEVGPDRMRARGLDPEGLRAFYRDRSLLKQTVLPAHVGQAVVFFAAGLTPTTGATLPVDAGVAGAFPR